LVLIVLFGLAACAESTKPSQPLPLLFSHREDALKSWGHFYQVAPALAPIATTSLILPKLVAAFDPNPLRPAAGYELFFVHKGAVYFTTSPDLQVNSPPVRVALLPVCINGTKTTPCANGTVEGCIVKTIGRSDAGDSYAMMQFCEGAGPQRRLSEGVRALTTSDPRVADSFTGSLTVAYHDHDDQQLIYDGDRQVRMMMRLHRIIADLAMARSNHQQCLILNVLLHCCPHSLLRPLALGGVANSLPGLDYRWLCANQYE
jgi:hypothetical protein